MFGIIKSMMNDSDFLPLDCIEKINTFKMIYMHMYMTVKGNLLRNLVSGLSLKTGQFLSPFGKLFCPVFVSLRLLETTDGQIPRDIVTLLK